MKQQSHAVKPRRQDHQQRYRRSKELWLYQIVRLDHEDAAALRALAERKHTTVAELIRTFVTWGLEGSEYRGADAD